MRITLSKRVIIAVMAIAILLSAANTFMIFYNATILNNQLNKVQRDYSADDSTFDYVIFQANGLVQAKNQTSGIVDFSSASASKVLNQAVTEGAAVYVKAGKYSLNTDVEATNKKNLKIVGDNATILGNGYKIVIKGDDYTRSQYNSISGFTIIDGTLRIENSFAVTIINMIFQNCSTALELANTVTWTEGTKIEDCHFINSAEAIAFRTPVQNSTGSYASSQINRCYFNLLDNSVGINVEHLAEYSDSQVENSRIWLGQNGKTNQTGLQLDGSMFQTTLSNVVFESFADDPTNFYAIAIGRVADTTPIIGEGVSFLGNWTARVYNPASKWILGQSSLFRRTNINVEVGANNSYGQVTNIHDRPLTISSFKPHIQVQGLNTDETVTVRLRLEFIDNAISQNVEKTFTTSPTTTWLSDDDMLKLFPSQNIIWAILIDAKSNIGNSNAVVKVDFYGETS